MEAGSIDWMEVQTSPQTLGITSQFPTTVPQCVFRSTEPWRPALPEAEPFPPTTHSSSEGTTPTPVFWMEASMRFASGRLPSTNQPCVSGCAERSAIATRITPTWRHITSSIRVVEQPLPTPVRILTTEPLGVALPGSDPMCHWVTSLPIQPGRLHSHSAVRAIA